MSLGLILVPVIAAFAGWLAARMAIRMLFYPEKPVLIAGKKFQGLIPAKQASFSAEMGKVLNRLGLLNGMEEKIADPVNFQKIMPLVEHHVDDFLRIRLVEKMPMIGMLIGERTIQDMKTVFIAELETLFPVVMANYMNSLRQGDNLEATITKKINDLLGPALKESIYAVLSKELRRLPLLAAICGFVVGLVQVFILLVL